MMTEDWAACYARYEQLKGREHWSALASAMLRLIDRIRADITFPETVQVVSHAWLRIGPPSSEPNYRPAVWVGWRKPNYYWFGVGSFGTKNRVTVSSERAVIMLKRYLANLEHLDPLYARYAESIPVDQWSREALAQRYAQLDAAQALPVLVDDLTTQARDIRTYVELLHEAVSGLDQIQGADHAIEEILRRLDRLNALAEVSAQRVTAQAQTSAEAGASAVKTAEAPGYQNGSVPHAVALDALNGG